MHCNDEDNQTESRYGEAEAKPAENLLMGQTGAKRQHVTTKEPLQCTTDC